MQKLILVAVALMFTGLYAVAQSSPSPSDASGGMSGQVNAHNSAMTVDGCLSGSAGTFTLRDKAGSIYNLTGDTSKLAAHVGQEVRVTAQANAGSSTPNSAGSAGTTASNGTSNALQTMHVSSLTKVSGSCSNTQ